MKNFLARTLLTLALVAPALATDVEKRVRFDAGSTGTVINGRIDPAQKKSRMGPGRDRYILGAGKGQTMVVQLTATGSAMVYIWHKDYNKGFLGTSTGTSISQTCKLPANADYYVDVESQGGAVDYKLTIEIR